MPKPAGRNLICELRFATMIATMTATMTATMIPTVTATMVGAVVEAMLGAVITPLFRRLFLALAATFVGLTGARGTSAEAATSTISQTVSTACAAPNWTCWQSAIGIQVFDQSGLVSTCTGVAVSAQHILTAAHCTQIAMTGRRLIWRLSSLENLNTTDPTTRRSTATDLRVLNPPIHRHPQYDPRQSRFHFDWAIIEVAHRFPRVRVWPQAWPIPRGQKLHRIGYGGRPNAQGELENRRTWITSFLNHDLSAADEFLESQDALGVPGDSGGPIFVWHQGQAWLVGLHSTWDPQLGLSFAPRLR